MAHINANPERLILDYVFDTAKVHDSRNIDDLTADEEGSVSADSAYMDRERSER